MPQPSAYGQPGAATTNAYGQPSAATTNAYGQPNTNASQSYGQPSQSYGQPPGQAGQPNRYGQGGQGNYGQNNAGVNNAEQLTVIEGIGLQAVGMAEAGLAVDNVKAFMPKSTEQKERTTMLDGRMNRKDKNKLDIRYDPELARVPCCSSVLLFCSAPCCCPVVVENRSYIYVRENSIEYNWSLIACGGCCMGNFQSCGRARCCYTCLAEGCDITTVKYFDREPLRKDRYCQPIPCCCCCMDYNPKFVVQHHGCTCCWCTWRACCDGQCGNCCAKSTVVVSPFDYFPNPCDPSGRQGCCVNRHELACRNCWGLSICPWLGGFCPMPIAGNPCVYNDIFGLFLIPKNPDAFCEYANEAMHPGTHPHLQSLYAMQQQQQLPAMNNNPVSYNQANAMPVQNTAPMTTAYPPPLQQSGYPATSQLHSPTSSLPRECQKICGLGGGNAGYNYV